MQIALLVCIGLMVGMVSAAAQDGDKSIQEKPK